MPPVSSTSGAQSAAQFGWQQLKLQQAQRNATQAEQNARALEAQANSAKLDADRAQESARSLEVQSGQARDNAGRARQGLAAIQSVTQTLTQLGAKVEQVAESQASTSTAPVPATTTTSTVSATPTTPVVNTQGETTGRIINTTA